MDIVSKTQDSGTLKYGYTWNYGTNLTLGSYSQSSPGGVWDTDKWDDTFIWGGQTYKQKREYIFGLGNNFQLKIYNDTVNEEMEILNFSLNAKQVGIGDIKR